MIKLKSLLKEDADEPVKKDIEDQLRQIESQCNRIQLLLADPEFNRILIFNAFSAMIRMAGFAKEDIRHFGQTSKK